MKYYFLVRDYSYDFFVELAKIISENKKNESFHFITMHSYVKYRAEKGVNNVILHYLPEQLKKKPNYNLLQKYDKEIYTKYGFGLNRLYSIERFKAQNNADEFIAKHVTVLDNVIKEPGTLVSLTMDHFVYILAGVINQIKGGNNIYLQPVGFPNKCSIIMANPYNNVILKNEDNDYLFEEYEKSMSQHPKETIYYMKEKLKKENVKEKVKKRIMNYKNKRELKVLYSFLTDYSYLDPIYITKRNKTLKYNNKKKEKTSIEYLNIKEIDEINKNGNKVFYYPLHLEPEMTILAYSPMYQNQLEAIKLTSSSLKIGDVLVIKENPKQNEREKTFIEEIQQLSNVKWVKTEENSREIIKKSFKVISLTGTACIEAAFLNVKSIFFGYPPFYKFLFQKPVSEIPLKEFHDYLYEDYGSGEIRKSLKAAWKGYSKSIVKYYLEMEPNNSSLMHTKIIDYKTKATKFYEIVLTRCAGF